MEKTTSDVGKTMSDVVFMVSAYVFFNIANGV